MTTPEQRIGAEELGKHMEQLVGKEIRQAHAEIFEPVDEHQHLEIRWVFADGSTFILRTTGYLVAELFP